MQATSSERRVAVRGRSIILTITELAASCDGNRPQDPVDAAVPDARPSDFAVRVSATGALGDVGLDLRVDDDSEALSVTAEGKFELKTRLETGTSYTVTIANPSMPCTLRNQRGVIAGADASIELTCTAAALASVIVSGIASAVTFVPCTTDYVVELPLSNPAVTLTATVAKPGHGPWSARAGAKQPWITAEHSRGRHFAERSSRSPNAPTALLRTGPTLFPMTRVS